MDEWNPGHTDLLQRKDVMTDALWKPRKLPAIIRAFQQHQLKAQRTSAIFAKMVYDYSAPVVESVTFDAQGLDRIIKDLLLDHHPRRHSKRDQQKGWVLVEDTRVLGRRFEGIG
jgi:hypothetical protein